MKLRRSRKKELNFFVLLLLFRNFADKLEKFIQ